MDWKEWNGKAVFVQLKKGSIYSGIVEDVDDSSDVIFITLKDRFGYKVTFVTGEIAKIKEE